MLKLTKPKPAILFDDWLEVAKTEDLWEFYLDMEEGSIEDIMLGEQVVAEIERRRNAESFMQRVWLVALVIGTLAVVALNFN